MSLDYVSMQYIFRTFFSLSTSQDNLEFLVSFCHMHLTVNIMELRGFGLKNQKYHIPLSNFIRSCIVAAQHSHSQEFLPFFKVTASNR